MHRDEAIRREADTLEEIARIGQELDALDILIFRFGQTRQDWYNPEMVKRLARAKRRLEQEQDEWRERRAYYASFI